MTNLRNLRRLTVFTCLPHSDGSVSPLRDLLRADVEEWIRSLVAQKGGVSFEKVVIYVKLWRAVPASTSQKEVSYWYDGDEGVEGPVIEKVSSCDEYNDWLGD